MSGVSRDRLSRRDRLRNWIRGLWPDRNLLRRGSDRAEAALIAALLVAFLAGAPLAVLLTGRSAIAVGTRAEQAGRGGDFQVSAVLLQQAPYQDFGWPYSPAEARWTAPDGSRHTGDISAPSGAPRGTTVRVWIDRSGAVAGEPVQAAQVASQAQAAAAAPFMLAFLLLTAGALARRYLNRRRLAAWESDWRATGPQWSHQR